MDLILNILPNYISRYFVSHTPDKISITPKLSCPQLFPQFRKLPEHFSCRNTFQYLHYLRRGISGWCFYKYVYMVFHDFHRIYLELVLLCNTSKHLFQILRNFPTQYMLPILRYPHQVILQIIYGVLRPSYAHAIFISPDQIFTQAPCSPRLTASHFPPASKLAGIQWGLL